MACVLRIAITASRQKVAPKTFVTVGYIDAVVSTSFVLTYVKRAQDKKLD